MTMAEQLACWERGAEELLALQKELQAAARNNK